MKILINTIIIISSLFYLYGILLKLLLIRDIKYDRKNIIQYNIHNYATLIMLTIIILSIRITGKIYLYILVIILVSLYSLFTIFSFTIWDYKVPKYININLILVDIASLSFFFKMFLRLIQTEEYPTIKERVMKKAEDASGIDIRRDNTAFTDEMREAALWMNSGTMNKNILNEIRYPPGYSRLDDTRPEIEFVTEERLLTKKL